MRAKHLIGALLASLMLAGGTAMTATAQQPAGTRSIDDKAAVCSACHGANGVPVSKEIPIIWGQHAGYLFLNLRDMQSGARKNEQMEAIVKTLSRGDLLALGVYFESKPWPDLQQPRAAADVVARAEAVATSGQCPQCHLGGYAGDSTNPRLAGQSSEYLRKTMRDFHNGTRGNNPWMAALLKTFADGDIDAMAGYLGGL
jgi:cytochrome c553